MTDTESLLQSFAYSHLNPEPADLLPFCRTEDYVPTRSPTVHEGLMVPER
jgi:hypothetical protein